MSRRALPEFITGLIIAFVATTSTSAQFTRIATIAGDGKAEKLSVEGAALETSLANPFGIGEEADGSLVICSFDWHVLYRLDASRKTLKVIAGSGAKGMGGSPGGPACGRAGCRAAGA